MLKKIFIAALVILQFAVSLYAETITLQQGADGYTGCDDAYVRSRDDDTKWNEMNHGDEEFLGACWQRYNPG